jgi:hypothetical protein
MTLSASTPESCNDASSYFTVALGVRLAFSESPPSEATLWLMLARATIRPSGQRQLARSQAPLKEPNGGRSIGRAVSAIGSLSSIVYRRTPSPEMLLIRFRPSFLRTVAERKPRTEWACQPVAVEISERDAPSVRRRRLINTRVLFAGRAPVVELVDSEY